MDSQNNNTPPPAFNNTCGRGPFSFGYEVNSVLANQIMADNGSSPWVLQCHNKTVSYPTTDKVKTCLDWHLTLCIGGHDQQHACAVGEDCSAVDWSGTNRANPCLRDLLSNASEFGRRTLGFFCCGEKYCSLADEDGEAEEDYTASCSTTGGYPDLWLCVKDKASASTSCVRPKDNSTCAGHFSDLLLSASSSATPYSTQPFYPSNTYSGSSSTTNNHNHGSSLSNAANTRIIAGTCIPAAALILISLASYFQYRRKRAQDKKLAMGWTTGPRSTP